jgi:LPXTG-motif cell wall-anchored protein
MKSWMKWLSSILCAAVLLAPVPAWAKKSDKYQMVYQTEVNGNDLKISAEIKGADSADGHWKLIPTGKGGEKAGLPIKEMDSTSTTFEHTYENLAPGEYCFNLKYEGKLDGSTESYPFLEKFCVEVKGEGNSEQPGESPGGGQPGSEESCPAEPDEEHFREISVEVSQSGDKLKVTAKLPGTEAEGTWYLAAGSMEEDKPAVEKTFDQVKGNTFTHELNVNDLPTGEVLIVVGFEGKVDGKECILGLGQNLIEVEDGQAEPAPEQPKAPTPETGKKGVDQLKGGKLPKTATQYPTGVLAGALLLAFGAMMLTFRRAQ